MNTNVITAVFGALRETKVRPRYRYNRGQVLVLKGIRDLPDYYEVHFANIGGEVDATPEIGTADGVIIPDSFFESAAGILAYIYVHDEATDGTTIYKVTIPIIDRPRPADTEPTEQETDIISQAIVALNENVGRAEESAATAQSAADGAAQAERNAGVSAERAEAAEQAAETSATGASSSAAAAQAAALSAAESESQASAHKDAAMVAADDAGAASASASDHASAAQSAAGQAEQYKNTAVAAGNAAQTAATNAGAARTAAEAAQTAAEGARSAAETAMTGAQTYAGQASQSATDAAQSAAGAAQTLGQVRAEGAVQIAAVDAEGQRVLDSIPEDYSQMEDDITDLKSQIDASPVESGSAVGSVQTKSFVYNNNTVTQIASGVGSFAEGYSTVAISNGAHSEGQQSMALTIASHAEGGITCAAATAAHAEGMLTMAAAQYSHAEGQGSTFQCKFTGAENSKVYSITITNMNDVQVGMPVVIVGIPKVNMIDDVDRVNSTVTMRVSFGVQLNNKAAFLLKSYALGNSSHCEGVATSALKSCAHAEGESAVAGGETSHAEGKCTLAGDNNSHAEGERTIAIGKNAHVEGNYAAAIGNSSHAQNSGVFLTLKVSGNENATSYTYTGTGDPDVGDYIVVNGKYAKITSVDTVNKEFTVNNTLAYYFNQKQLVVYRSGAFGNNSHVEGKGTTAIGDEQHAQGRYNVLDNDGVYAEIVGNGTAYNARSNARTLDWDGNESLAGSITLGKGTENEVTLSAAQLKQLLALLN